MQSYVNHQAMGDLYRPLEHYPNPLTRAAYLKNLLDELAIHTTKHAQKVCYDLKKEGWSIGAIADELGVSGRMAKRLITAYSAQNKVLNPLYKNAGIPVEIDITHLVSRESARRQRSEETTHPTT